MLVDLEKKRLNHRNLYLSPPPVLSGKSGYNAEQASTCRKAIENVKLHHGVQQAYSFRQHLLVKSTLRVAACWLLICAGQPL